MPKLPIKEVRRLVESMVDNWFNPESEASSQEDYAQDIEDLYSDIMTGAIQKKVVKKEKEVIPWKEEYKIYKAQAEAAMHMLIRDDLFIQELIDESPDNWDIPSSIERSFKRYWSTESAWKKKKRTQTKVIDWKSTIRKTIEINKVFKTANYKRYPDSEPELAL